MEERSAPGRPPLRVLPDVRFTCDGQGTCCSQGWRLGPLTEEDRRAILAHEWAGFIPGAPRPADRTFRAELGDAWSERWFLEKRDERCVFLLDDGLCGIHKRLGAGAKPHFCRMFPFTVALTPAGRFVGVRGDCSCRGRSRASGQPVAEQLDAIEALLGEPEAGGSFAIGARTPWTAAVEVPFELAAAVRAAALAALEAPGEASLEERLQAVRDVADAVHRALGERPGPAELAAALAAASSLEEARAGRPPEPFPGAASASGREALVSLLSDLAGWLARHGLRLGALRIPRSAVEECLRAVYHILDVLDPPSRYAPVFGDSSLIAVDFGASPRAPGPRAFLDDLRNELFGWMLNGYPMLPGLAVSLLQYVILRCAARLRAARRGDLLVSAEDVEVPLTALKFVSRMRGWTEVVRADPERLLAFHRGWPLGSRVC